MAIRNILALNTTLSRWETQQGSDTLQIRGDAAPVFQVVNTSEVSAFSVDTVAMLVTVPAIAISGALPSLDFYDTDCDDADINAQIYANATTLTTGAEVVDLSMFQQIGGTLLRTYFSDADVGIYLYPKGLTTGIISFTPDITYYKTIANGNPELRIGSDDANEAHFKAMYDSGAQTLDYLLISTDSAGEGDIVLNPASTFVGINKTAPAYALDITGTVKADRKSVV